MIQHLKHEDDIEYQLEDEEESEEEEEDDDESEEEDIEEEVEIQNIEGDTEIVKKKIQNIKDYIITIVAWNRIN